MVGKRFMKSTMIQILDQKEDLKDTRKNNKWDKKMSSDIFFSFFYDIVKIEVILCLE